MRRLFHTEIVKHNQIRRPQFVKQIKFASVAVESRFDVVKQARDFDEDNRLAVLQKILRYQRRKESFARAAFAEKICADFGIQGLFGEGDGIAV